MEGCLARVSNIDFMGSQIHESVDFIKVQVPYIRIPYYLTSLTYFTLLYFTYFRIVLARSGPVGHFLSTMVSCVRIIEHFQADYYAVIMFSSDFHALHKDK